MSTEIMHKATWAGTFHIFGVDVQCFVLEDGSRVGHADALRHMQDALKSPDRHTTDKGDMDAFWRWQRRQDN